MNQFHHQWREGGSRAFKWCLAWKIKRWPFSESSPKIRSQL